MTSLNLGRLLAILQLLLFLQVFASATTVPTVNLGYAQYQGAADIVTNTTSFLGIRYAATPVGTRSVVVVRAFHRGLIDHPSPRKLAMGRTSTPLHTARGTERYDTA